MFRIKWLAFLMAILLFLTGTACAEEVLPEELVLLLKETYPLHTIRKADLCGPAAAVILSDENSQILCMAEERNGTWHLAVANDKALRQGEEVISLLLDTDDALFWTYENEIDGRSVYHAVQKDGQWRVGSRMRREQYDNGNASEYHLSYGAGRLQYSTYLCDENDNILSSDDYEPVPAAWLEEKLDLTVFDAELFDFLNESYTHSWMAEEAYALAAEELFPEYIYLGGCAEKNHLEFFLQNAQGELLIAASRYDEQKGWKSVLSTPLPEGTRYGYENFTSSLVIGDLLVNIAPMDQQTYGVSFIYDGGDHGEGESMFQLGKNWICYDVPVGYGNVYGDHPWGDITMIDWTALPHSFEEALAGLDSSRWAVVNNPNPEDRLHLRTKADKHAQSLGKYYNGTPVRVLEEKRDWVRVNIFGVEGWMMKRYLAFGDQGRKVEAVFPSRMPLEEKKDHFIYDSPQKRNLIGNCKGLYGSALVLGIVEDQWYHVWFPDSMESGYILQEEWFEGNG